MEILALMLDEVWDLTEAIDELERRRATLRDGILAACRRQEVTRWRPTAGRTSLVTARRRHARGALRIDRYGSYEVARPTDVLPLLRAMGWEDRALQVKGRALHRLAEGAPHVRPLLGEAFQRKEHEVLVLTPKRGRRWSLGRGPREAGPVQRLCAHEGREQGGLDRLLRRRGVVSLCPERRSHATPLERMGFVKA